MFQQEPIKNIGHTSYNSEFTGIQTQEHSEIINIDDYKILNDNIKLLT